MIRFSQDNELANIKKILINSMMALGNWKESVFTEQQHNSKTRKGKGKGKGKRY